MRSLTRGVPGVFTAIFKSRSKSYRFKHAQVRNLSRKVPRFSRPLNSGIVEGMNIAILVGWAGAVYMGAAVARAAARLLLSIYHSSLANCSSVKLAIPPSSSFEKLSLLCSAIPSQV